MKKSFLAVLVAIVGLAGVGIGILAARAGRVKAAQRSSSTQEVTKAAVAPADKSIVIRFAKDPQPAPPFLLRDLDGNLISTASWQGKVVLVNFWATWCPPCREEIPVLIDLAKKYKDGLLIVGVSMDDGPAEEVRQFAQGAGINYPIVMRSHELVAEYGGVPALPTSFFINKEGRVVQKHEGLFSPTLYETEIRALLGLPVDATIETFEDTGQIFLKNAARATSLPGVDFSGLTSEQKKIALKRLNSEICDCGCGLTLAQCRINDTTCPVSKALAAKVVKEILAGTAPPPGHTASSPTPINQ
ncbi:MAG: TlpA family protein disulfide reductase [Candidatus Acidiferrales bacterium]